ncbi:MAG: PilN domain-containing protein [Parcubacteria group bacterium]
MEIKLNLIPPNKKEEIKKNKRLKTAIKSEVVLTVLLVGFFIVLLSFRYILDVGLSGEAILNSEIEKADQFEKIKDYNKQFNEANDQIKQIALIDQSQLYWSRVFVKISQLIPAGIAVDSLETENYMVTLSGHADMRGDLIGFKSGLESEDCFSDVDLPLSNLVDKADAEFKIVFKVDEGCLKKQADK